MLGFNFNRKNHFLHVACFEQLQHFRSFGYIFAPLNSNTHPTPRFLKRTRRNPTTPIVDHKTKWESTWLTNDNYVVGVIEIPYRGFGVIINIFLEENISYYTTLGNIPHCTFHKNVISYFQKERKMGALQTSLWCV